jgi:divalent metal cation (Fe/Co/Zn/Cd) transporter
VDLESGGLLFALATFVGIASGAALLGSSGPRRSLVGIALLIAASIVMPGLANEKRLLAAISGSTALRADAAEAAVCGYLAWITLAGLLLNAVWNLRWTVGPGPRGGAQGRGVRTTATVRRCPNL